MLLVIGSHLGPYRIASLLGAGGMGEVYRAQDERLGREVAIKVLRREAVADPDRQRRFALEARAAGTLNHPNILTVYDVGIDEGVPYIVTELVSGEPLTAVIARGPISTRKALDYAIQVTAGLAAAHHAGIVHRDLKPANVMVTNEGLVKILDFGLAKSVRQEAAAAGAGSTDTAPGFIVGTPTYMSPEQVKGESMDHRTDQFSLGLLVYEMIAGKAAFARSSAISTMAAIMEERPQPLSQANPAIPLPLRWCVERCLEKDREGRYVSTADLRREFETIRDHLEEYPSSGPIPAPDLKPQRRRGHLLPVLLGLGGLAAGVAVTGEVLVSPSATDMAATRLRPAAIAAEFARSPVFSSDGKSIVFTAAVNNVRQLFVRDLSAATGLQITNSATDCERPFWSADDSRVFYFSANASAGSDLYDIGATGGAAEVVQPNASAAAINRKSNALAFLRADPSSKRRVSLWIADPGKPPRLFTGRPFNSDTYQAGYLAFSPDGKSLGVWASRWIGNSEFWVISWPDGQTREAFSTQQRAYPFSWMPDSRNIVYGGDAPGSFGSDLQMADTRNGRMRPLTFLTRDAVEASVSPDGRRIAFVASEDNFDIILAPLGGSLPQKIPNPERVELFDPAWAPSGDAVAVSTDRTGASEIWLRSVREGWVRPVVKASDFERTKVAELTEPDFSPDGRRIAYSVAGSNGHSIYISAVAGSKPIRLSTESTEERAPSWNGDGSWIAYLRNNGGSWSLVKAASGGTSTPILLRDGCLRSHPRWNPVNSHWIACVAADGLTLVSSDGKDTLPLSKENWLVFGWSKDGKALYGIKETVARRRVIVSMDIDKRSEKELGEMPFALASEIRGFSLSPDGKSFATSAIHPNGNLWTLEGFRQPGLLSWLRN